MKYFELMEKTNDGMCLKLPIINNASYHEMLNKGSKQKIHWLSFKFKYDMQLI